MKSRLFFAAAALLALGATANAQDSTTKSETRIRIHKDRGAATTTTTRTDSMPGMAMTNPNMPMEMPMEWYYPTGTTCGSVDVTAARAVSIKSDLYNSATMISPDSAKVIALCAVPGQIGSGEMNVANGLTEYAIDIIPNHKKTHTKVIVDAQTGAVLSSKQFGGLRGLAGWVRESAEHKTNTKKDTIP
jgi:hypothetical protein